MQARGNRSLGFCRQQILSLYAQQLEGEELHKVAAACEGMSGRDLRDICEQAERRTASQVPTHLSLALQYMWLFLNLPMC